MIKQSISYFALCLSCLLLLSACGNKVSVSSGTPRYQYPAQIETTPKTEEIAVEIEQESAVEAEGEIAEEDEDDDFIIEIDEEQYQREIRGRR